MHLVIPGMLVVQLEEEGPELKAPSWSLEGQGEDDLDKDGGQGDDEMISPAAPEKSGAPPVKRPGGLLFEGS